MIFPVLTAVVMLGVVMVGVVWSGRVLFRDIRTIRRGRKFPGTCGRYKIEYHRSGHDVEWVGENGGTRRMRFMCFVPGIRYPKKITVYDDGANANIGIYTIFADIPAFLLTLGILALTTAAIVEYINQI